MTSGKALPGSLTIIMTIAVIIAVTMTAKTFALIILEGV